MKILLLKIDDFRTTDDIGHSLTTVQPENKVKINFQKNYEKKWGNTERDDIVKIAHRADEERYEPCDRKHPERPPELHILAGVCRTRHF